ncbi:MAG: Nif3-like dinuclear metal center hexameric protein, partial [Burkholderiales bacterium]
MRLIPLVAYLDDFLRVRDVRDAPEALNGLQIENAGEVTRLAAAVDLCEATVRLAVDAHADLLLVHHGLFWGGPVPLSGPVYRRVSALIAHNVALYAVHLPLDCHPDLGNAVLLARLLGVGVREPFGDWHGQACGVWGELDTTRDALAARLTATLGTAPRVLAFGPERIRRLGIVTGAGGSMIPQAATAGLDAYITGEGTHHSYVVAEELRLNVYYGGHYATETFGVRRLGELLAARFGVEHVWLDLPNPV